MHILFLTNEYPKKGLNGGGIGSFVQFLGCALVKEGVAVSVVGINNSSENEFEIDAGVAVHRLSKSTCKVGKFYDNTKRILSKISEINKGNTVDVVEGSELNFAFFPKKTTYKKVIRLHGGHHFFAIELNKKPALWRGFQEKQSFKKADGYIAVSNYVGMQTQKYLKSKFKFTTIYNSVDTQKFKPIGTFPVVKNSLLFVGTVCEKKGIRQLVQAMPLIKKEIPDVTLKIVGRDWLFPNGDSYIEYLNSFITNEVKSAIEIVGAVPLHKMSEHLSAAAICVYPSQTESFGLTVIEALLMQKPVVCSKIPPFLEIKGEQEILKAIDTTSVDKIATEIVALLKSENKAVHMGEMARKEILIRFNPEMIVNQNINFYKNL